MEMTRTTDALTASPELPHHFGYRYDYRCLSRPLAQVRTLIAKI